VVATIVNLSGEPDIDGEPKTYDLEIEHEGERYWKLGLTCQTIAKRFRAEPRTTRIVVRQLWRHKTVVKAEAHEQKLFRLHKGDLPFIGKMGPLVKGGNTEVFSHDAVGGRAPPATFKAVVFGSDGWSDTHVCHLDYDPYSRWETQYRWVPALVEPQELSMVIETKSSLDTLVVCTVEHLEKIAEGRVSGPVSRTNAQRLLEQGRYVGTYSEAYRTLYNWR
jgi:hypothetical protein